MDIPLLELQDIVINYGHINAVKGINLKVIKGKITSLVGSNGAGKTTVLLGISKILKLKQGRIFYQSKDITHLKPHEIVRSGIVHVPEGREILNYLKVIDNIKLGAYSRKDKKYFAADLENIFALFPILKDRSNNLAGNLSGGEQQMLAIARALMAKPNLLILDEPSMGLAPILVDELFRVILEINKSGITILLVEQNIKQALKISEYGYVLETGKIVLSDTGEKLLDNPKLIEAYLGNYKK